MRAQRCSFPTPTPIPNPCFSVPVARSPPGTLSSNAPPGPAVRRTESPASAPKFIVRERLEMGPPLLFLCRVKDVPIQHARGMQVERARHHHPILAPRGGVHRRLLRPGQRDMARNSGAPERRAGRLRVGRSNRFQQPPGRRRRRPRYRSNRAAARCRFPGRPLPPPLLPASPTVRHRRPARPAWPASGPASILCATTPGRTILAPGR